MKRSDVSWTLVTINLDLKKRSIDWTCLALRYVLDPKKWNRVATKTVSDCSAVDQRFVPHFNSMGFIWWQEFGIQQKLHI